MPSPPDPAESPCVRRCTLNDDDICIGCGRTLADIAAWGGMSPAERIACKQRAAERWPALQFGDDDAPATPSAPSSP